MKAPRKKKAQAGRQTFRFTRRDPWNVLDLIVSETRVTIRATRGNFLPREQEVFVHYLADEGFIPECYRGFSANKKETWNDLEWLTKEDSIAGRESSCRRGKSTDRFMTRLMICALALWLFEITTLFLIPADSRRPAPLELGPSVFADLSSAARGPLNPASP